MATTAKKLATFKDRSAAHAKLAEVLAAKPCKYPDAECRENPGADEYSVWSGPAEKREKR